MKKFTENINEKNNHYAGDQKIYNDLYNLIDETLKPKMNGNISEAISLNGKEELVKELSKIVENEITKTKISVLEKYKKQPSIIQEKEQNEDIFLTLMNESLSQEKTGYNPLEQYIKEYFYDYAIEDSDLSDEYEREYDNAPQEVKDLIDEYGDDPDYDKLAILKDELFKLGYDMDYGLDSQITSLKKQ